LHILRRLRIPLIIGATAAAMTLILFAIAAINPGYTGFPYIDAALKLGVALAMIPFGGIDGSTLPTLAVAVIGSLFNGTVGVILGSAALWLYHRGGQTPASAIEHHVT
jgi:hypothetical protein